MVRRLCVGLLVVLFSLGTVEAQTTVKKPPAGKSDAPKTVGPHDYSSKNFVLHTDLSEDEA